MKNESVPSKKATLILISKAEKISLCRMAEFDQFCLNSSKFPKTRIKGISKRPHREYFFHLTYAFSVPPTKVDAKQPAQAAAGEIVIGHQ